MWYVHHFIYFLFLLLVVFVFVRGGILKCSLCLQRMNQVCCCPKNHKRAKMFCIVLITFFIWWMVSLLWLTFTPFIVGVMMYNGYNLTTMFSCSGMPIFGSSFVFKFASRLTWTLELECLSPNLIIGWDS